MREGEGMESVIIIVFKTAKQLNRKVCCSRVRKIIITIRGLQDRYEGAKTIIIVILKVETGKQK